MYWTFNFNQELSFIVVSLEMGFRSESSASINELFPSGWSLALCSVTYIWRRIGGGSLMQFQELSFQVLY